jgi:hypothetical protein
MQALRTPNAAYEHPAGRGEVVHQLISGGTAVTRRPQTRRQWSLGWGTTTPDTADPLVQFYAGMYGDGPFRFVDPAWRNALSVDASTFGIRQQAITEWGDSSPGAVVTYDSTVAAAIPGSGVARWTSVPQNGQFALGAWNGAVFIPDAVLTPPYLPQAVTSITMYARSVTGTPNVTLRSKALLADGTVVNTTSGTSATLSTSAWTKLTVLMPAALVASYASPNVICNTSGVSIIQFSNPLVEYGETPADNWVVGLGIPNVVISSGLGATSELLYARDHTLTLAEI